jgi:hypothetical protein
MRIVLLAVLAALVAAAPSLPPRVIAIPLDGCGPYFAGVFEIGGTPFRLLVDTGSGLVAIAGSSCDDCMRDGVSDRYSPGSGAIDEGIAGSAAYGGGSRWFGEAITDRVGASGIAAASARTCRSKRSTRRYRR